MQTKNQDILAIIIFSTLFFVSLIVILLIKNSLVIYIFNLIVTFSCQGLQTIIFVKYVKSTVKNGYIYDSIYYRDFLQNSGRTTTIILFILSGMFPLVFGLGIISSVITGIFGVLSVKSTSNNQKTQISNTAENL